MQFDRRIMRLAFLRHKKKGRGKKRIDDSRSKKSVLSRHELGPRNKLRYSQSNFAKTPDLVSVSPSAVGWGSQRSWSTSPIPMCGQKGAVNPLVLRFAARTPCCFRLARRRSTRARAWQSACQSAGPALGVGVILELGRDPLCCCVLPPCGWERMQWASRCMQRDGGIDLNPKRSLHGEAGKEHFLVLRH